MQIAGHRMYFLTSELCSWAPTWSARGPEKALSWWAGGRCPGRGFHPAHCTTESCVSDLPGGAFSVLVTLVTRESPDSEARLSPHCLPSPDSCSLWLSCLRLVCKVSCSLPVCSFAQVLAKAESHPLPGTHGVAGSDPLFHLLPSMSSLGISLPTAWSPHGSWPRWQSLPRPARCLCTEPVSRLPPHLHL